jgi:hypothetical protein
VIRSSYFDPEKHNISEFIEKFKILLDLKGALGSPMIEREKIEKLQRSTK